MIMSKKKTTFIFAIKNKCLLVPRLTDFGSSTLHTIFFKRMNKCFIFFIRSDIKLIIKFYHYHFIFFMNENKLILNGVKLRIQKMSSLLYLSCFSVWQMVLQFVGFIRIMSFDFLTM